MPLGRATGGAVAAALLLTACGGASGAGSADQGSSVVLAERAAEPGAMTAEQAVRDPMTELVSLAVSTQDDGTRASIWRPYCQDEPCGTDQYALAVTADGYARTAYVALADGLEAAVVAAGSSFVVAQGKRLTVVDPRGRTRPVAVRRVPAPVAEGEVLVNVPTTDPTNAFAPPTPYAVDPAAVTAHPLRLPDRGTDHVLQDPTGRLVALDARADLTWSTDGGETWSKHPLDHRYPAFVIGSADPQTLAVGYGSGVEEGSTAQWEKTVVSRDAGRTWQESTTFPGVAVKDMGLPAWAVVSPQGRLLAMTDVGASSDGPWTSERADFGSLVRTRPGLPPAFAAEAEETPVPVLLHGAPVGPDGRQRVYVSDADQDLWVSVDEGRTWKRERSR